MNDISEKNKLIYLSYFKGREDYFAFQGKDFYRPINQSLSSDYITNHFKGFVTFGIYVLTKSSLCNFICIDIDIPKSELDKVKFDDQNEKYKYLKDELFTLQKIIIEELKIDNNSILLEDSGGRGYHIWIFFEESIPGNDALKLFYIIKNFTDLDFEFFPKQSNLTERRRYGNLIKLPLGIHQNYNYQSVFFTISDSTISIISPLENNIKHLQKIKKVEKKKVEQIIRDNKNLIEEKTNLEIKNDDIPSGSRIYYEDELDFLFQNCNALNQLKKKAEQNVELSHAEMFHFANCILSIPDKEDFLVNIIQKSYGVNFNRDYTSREIALIKNLYPTSCNKLIQEGICKRYCNDSIKKLNSNTLYTNTTPLSFWLNSQKIKRSIKNEELLDFISDIENIKNAYWKLKKYHKYEDVLFFDEFDFEQFEKYLDIYAEYISLYFQEKEEIPFLGYLKVNLPKKVDENGEMQYRQMAYSTVFDQVIIQIIFEAISIIFEEDFQDSSFGYRYNTNTLYSDEIFQDWREFYYQFRNKILNKNRESNVNYRIKCDIRMYYDNIQHDILLQQVQKYINEEYIIRMIKRIIELYKYDDKKKKGLPQGPAYARILANLYLNEFDKKISQSVLGYYRYVDDLFFFVKNEKDAEDCLKKVTHLLDDLGLEFSQDINKKPTIDRKSVV